MANDKRKQLLGMLAADYLDILAKALRFQDVLSMSGQGKGFGPFRVEILYRISQRFFLAGIVT